ncbi:unnamed protein product [Sphacelaria rigidula]
MRADTKVKVERRKHTIDLLHWLYSRRRADLDGTKLSLEHRRRQKGGVSHSRQLTYGEVDVPDFLSILDVAKPQKGEIFVDLGSGTGKAVVAAACGFPEFSQCRGIELVEGLVNAANDHVQTVRTFLASNLAEKHDLSSTSVHAHSGPGVEGDILSPQQLALLKNGVQPPKHANGKGKCKKGKAASRGAKTADQGIGVKQLEDLIVGVLTSSENEARQGTPPPSTAQDVAARLVNELGHRRYKASIRGYGGLQKFLVGLTKSQTVGQRLHISPDGSMVSLRPTSVESIECGQVEAPTPPQCNADSSDRPITIPFEIDHTAVKYPVAALEVNKMQVNTRSHRDESTYAIQHAIPPAQSLLDSPSRCPLAPACTVSAPVVCESSDGLCTESRVPCSSSPSAVIPGLMGSLEGESGRSGAGGNDGTGSNGNEDGALVEGNQERCRLPKAGPVTCEALDRVQIYCGDIFQEPWHDAGVVYAASLLFDDATMARLCALSKKLKQGARIISLRPIPSSSNDGNYGVDSMEGIDCRAGIGDAVGRLAAPMPPVLRLLHEGVFKMSWNMARVYIYVRL